MEDIDLHQILYKLYEAGRRHSQSMVAIDYAQLYAKGTRFRGMINEYYDKLDALTDELENIEKLIETEVRDMCDAK